MNFYDRMNQQTQDERLEQTIASMTQALREAIARGDQKQVSLLTEGLESLGKKVSITDKGIEFS